MKKTTLLLALVLLANTLIFFDAKNMFAQTTLYNTDVIQKLELTFSQSNWDYILDTMKQNNSTNRLVANAILNGVALDSVGVSYKGNSSYNANNQKNPFHIEIDYVKTKQDYEGYTALKLSNVSHDPSFLREVLSYEIARNYMPAPESNFMEVYINNAYHGLYVSSEDLSNDFCATHYYSSGNSFFNCDKPDGVNGPPQAPNLTYLGTDSSLYQTAYEIQSTYGWNDLKNLTNVLNNDFNNISTVLDADRALWMLVFNNLLVNLDSYTGSIGHNYYIYKDDNNRFNTIVWDLNESFGKFANAGIGTNLSFAQMQNMDPLLHQSNNARPLIKKMLTNSTYKKMYIAHYRTMLDEMITSNYYYTRGLELQTLINSSVQNDTKKFFTYNDFLNNLSSNAANAIGLSTLMNTRKTFLQTHAEFTKIPPTISNITPPVTATLGQNINITTQLTTTVTYAYIGYRYDSTAAFTRANLYDDGLHQDGAANDQVFGASLPATLSSDYVQYYVYAENNDAGAFSPPRAEYEFYLLALTVPLSTLTTGQIVINEAMASNTTTITDEKADYDDWIELYNTTNTPLSTTGLYLSDNPAQPTKWRLPLGFTLMPNSYLLIWADNEPGEGTKHTNFKLSKQGETLTLAKADSTLLDQTTFGTQVTDITTGRYPNGTGSFVYMPPTPMQINIQQPCTFAPTFTTTATALCGGTTATYTVENIAGSTYQWNVNNGTIISGQGTSSVVIQWNTNVNTGNIQILQTLP